MRSEGLAIEGSGAAGVATLGAAQVAVAHDMPAEMQSSILPLILCISCRRSCFPPFDLGLEPSAGFGAGHAAEEIHHRHRIVMPKRPIQRSEPRLSKVVGIVSHVCLATLDAGGAVAQLPVGPHDQKPVTDSLALVASIRV